MGLSDIYPINPFPFTVGDAYSQNYLADTD